LETLSRELARSVNEKMERLPGVAPGPSTWQEEVLLLNYSREIKRAGSFALPARAISTKNKHLLVIYKIPTRGFTAAVSVFMGTPPAKPLDCRIRLNTFGAHFFDLRAEPTGGEPRLSCALISLVFGDIIEMSLRYNSQFVHLLIFLVVLHCCSGQQKTLLTFGKQG
jgi:hypothetical protein